LPALADELVRGGVSVIVTATRASEVRVAQAATKTIPIVFIISQDPIVMGLVASLNRPGGNTTGAYYLNTMLAGKRLEMLHELAPAADRIAILTNPDNPVGTATWEQIESGAKRLGLKTQAFNARNGTELDAAFAAIRRTDALLLIPDPVFFTGREQVVMLASRLGIPAMFTSREYVAAGGLMSYGGSIADAYYQAGLYTGRILKGAKPPDLPVVQAARFELVINLKAAKALGLTIPATLLATADEVIE
jgi:putative ABC transport system substrate-binding protein